MTRLSRKNPLYFPRLIFHSNAINNQLVRKTRSHYCLSNLKTKILLLSKPCNNSGVVVLKLNIDTGNTNYKTFYIVVLSSLTSLITAYFQNTRDINVILVLKFQQY